MATTMVPSAPSVDLTNPGTYNIRLGSSILEPREARRWTSVRYNHKPSSGRKEERRGRILHDSASGDKLQLVLDEQGGGYHYDGHSREGEDRYVLICNGEAGHGEWTLEKLSSAYAFNLVRTPEERNADKLAQQYRHLPPEEDDDGGLPHEEDEDLEGQEADSDNPFDFRHFLKEEALKTAEAPRSAAGTPSVAPVRPAISTPIARPFSKANPFAPAQKTKRKAPSAASKPATTKKPKNSSSAAVKQDAPDTDEKKQPQHKPSGRATEPLPRIRVDRKASVRHDPNDADCGELILENEPSQSRNSNAQASSSMSLALSGQLSAGPISLRSAANSPASQLETPEPAEDRVYEFEFGGAESPELEEGQVDGDGDEDADADVEDLELPSPAQEQTKKMSGTHRRMSMAQPAGEAGAGGGDDDEDDLEKALELELIRGLGEDEEEESEEE